LRYSGFLSAVLGCCGLALVGGAAAGGDCVARPAAPAEVADVLDGDTLTLTDGSIVRLAGVEAPKRLPGQAAGTEPGSATAARSALRALALGREVSVQEVGGRDRYERVAAILTLSDGRSLQEAMVGRGMARIHGADPCLPKALGSLESAARQARLGMWADPDFAVRDAADPSLRTQKGLYQLVEGRIVSVGRGTRLVFLNFGKDWKRDFTVTVATDLATRLAPGGDPVNAFSGKRVIVRGVVEDNGGPQIRVTDESGIEILGDDGTGAAD
jgi:endonuclease YncB( thermonuclease family)